MRMAEAYDRRGDELLLETEPVGSSAAANNERISGSSSFLIDS